MLLRTLSVLEKKCEDVNRTAEELETLESSSNLFLGSLALSKTQREYLDFLKRRKEAVAKSLEELLAAKESGATGKREPGNVASLRRAMANRPDTVDAVWDVCAGSRFDEDNPIETERERRWLYTDTFWLCARLMQLEKVTDCMGSDSPHVFRKALKDGRDYVWVLVSGKCTPRRERERDLSPRDNYASDEDELISSV